MIVRLLVLTLSLTLPLGFSPTPVLAGKGVRDLAQGKPASIGKTLPEESYIAHTAKRLAHPKLLWVHPSLAGEKDQDILDAFAWGIPNPTDAPSAFTEETATVYADRYGGTGIGENWGSGRAAEKGGIQIKGLGATTLVGETQGKSHSNGTVPIEEAIREVIWSQVNQGTPHGSNRVLALIDRGTWTQLGGGTVQKDVLVIRESSLRPAHFMKSPFGSGEKMKKSEPARLVATGKYFAKTLGKIFDLPSGLSDGDKIRQGLQIYIQRIAEQYAYLYANRMYHGATSQSNIELTGRMIDFGTMTAQPGYGRIQVLDHVQENGEISEFIETLVHDFIEEVQETVPKNLKKFFPEPNLSEKTFRSRYSESVAKEFIILLGVDRKEAQNLVSDPEIRKLGDELAKLADYGSEKVKARYTVPEKLQKFDVNALFVDLATTQGRPTAIENTLARYIPGTQFAKWRQTLAQGYLALMKKTTANPAFVDRAKKLNAPHPELYRWKAMDANFKVIADYEKSGDASLVRSLIDQTLQLATGNADQNASTVGTLANRTGGLAPIIRAGHGISQGNGMAPNEFRPDLFYHQLKKKTGAYIGVGSFRALNAFAVGDFKLGIFLDFDEKVCQLNQKALKLSAEIPSRREFLARLFFGEAPGYRTWKPKAEWSEDEFIQQLKTTYQEAKTNISRDPATATFVHDFFDPKSQWGYAAIDRFQSNHTWKDTILGSDELYQRLRKRAQSGSFAIIQGSLVDDEALKVVHNELNSKNLSVSTLDISNADSHIYKALGKNGIDKLANEIEKLPWEEKGSLLSTTKEEGTHLGYFGGNRELDHWHYLNQSPQSYATRARNAESFKGIWARDAELGQLGIQPEDEAVYQATRKKLIDNAPTASTQKILWITGTMGSGKSTVLKLLAEEGGIQVKDFVVIDPDLFTLKAPTYARSSDPAYAADLMHYPSVNQAWALVVDALRAGKNIIVQGSFRNLNGTLLQLDEMAKLAPKAVMQNIRIEAPLEMALQRNDQRRLDGSHFVPPDQIIQGAKDAETVLKATQDRFQSIIRIENLITPRITGVLENEKWQGLDADLSQASMILDGSIGPRKVKDPSLYNRCRCAFLRYCPGL
ncbi:MAG: zeta toxin family protein [Bdellovibrionales bacterium]|nr:zeta toxin family protein [Bdellovibrionales bacterium]